MPDLDGPQRHVPVYDGSPGVQKAAPHVADGVGFVQAGPVGQQELEAEGILVHSPRAPDCDGVGYKRVLDVSDSGGNQVVVRDAARDDCYVGREIRPVRDQVVKQRRALPGASRLGDHLRQRQVTQELEVGCDTRFTGSQDVEVRVTEHVHRSVAGEDGRQLPV